MEIPKNVITYDMTSSTLWFDELGILYSAPKPGVTPDMTLEQIKAEMEKLRDITGNKKVCMVVESHPRSKPPSKEERDLIATDINNVAKAMAVITTSPVSRMIANLFFGLKPPPYPAKMFSNEKEAVEWIRQFNK